MLAELLQQLIAFIGQHPYWALAFVFLSALLESLAVVGLFVPGAVVMFGIGALVATGALDFWAVCGWSIAGAVAGDGISFWLGRHYHQQLRELWPFRRHPELIERGTAFFHRHGGKSVVLARFVGPVRPVLPAIAGMLDMPPWRFLAVNVLSACLWAPAYLLPGVAFGASLELASEVAGRLAILLFLLLASATGLFWGMRRLALWLQHHVNRVLDAIGRWARRHPRLQPLEAALLEPDAPESRGLFVLSLSSAGLFALLAWVLRSALVGMDQNLHAFLQGLRTPLLDEFLVVFTQLGNARVVTGAALLSAGWLFWRRAPSTALHLLASLAAAGATGWLVKAVTAVPRPTAIYTGVSAWSFPSMHATLTAAFIGFVAVAAARALRPERRWIAYALAALYIALMDFSRLYLGVHWLTDVVAGTGIGLGFASLFGIAYRRHAHERLPLAHSALPPVLALGLLAALGPARDPDALLAQYRPAPQATRLSRENWLATAWANQPAAREDLAGAARHPLTLQIAATLSSVRDALAPLGWAPPRPVNARTLLRLFATGLPLEALPVMPQIHAGHRDRLRLLYQDPETGGYRLLRLWPGDLVLEESNLPVWIGNVARLEARTLAGFMRFPVTAGDFEAATRALVRQLRALPGWRVHERAREDGRRVWLVEGPASLPPAHRQGVRHADPVEDARDHEVHQILDRLGPVIETGTGGQDHRPEPGQLQHVLEMDHGQGRLAGHQHQGPAFLDRHVGGPLDEAVAGALGDRRQGPHGAGADHHRARRVRAGGRGRRPLPGAEDPKLALLGPQILVEEAFQLAGTPRQLELRLQPGHDPGGIGEHQPHGLVGLDQALEQAQGILDAGGTGDGDGDRTHVPISRAARASSSRSWTPPKAPLLITRMRSPDRASATTRATSASRSPATSVRGRA